MAAPHTEDITAVRDGETVYSFGDQVLVSIFKAYEKYAKKKKLPIKEYPEDEDDKVEMWMLDEESDMGCISFDDMYENTYRLIYSNAWLIGIHKLFDAVIRLRYKDLPYYEEDIVCASMFLSPGDCFDVVVSLEQSFAGKTMNPVTSEFLEFMKESRDSGTAVELKCTISRFSKKKWPHPEKKVEESAEEDVEDEDPENEEVDADEEEADEDGDEDPEGEDEGEEGEDPEDEDAGEEEDVSPPDEEEDEFENVEEEDE